MENEKNLLRKAFTDNKDRLKEIFQLMTRRTITSEKSAEQSELARNRGNKLFQRKNHDAEAHIRIFRYYCQSIAFAPLDSEVLAKAYANRSAFLLHIHKLKECIRDIDRTLEITKSDMLTIKLLCRKVECMKKLALPNYQSVLDEAENYSEKMDMNNKTQVDKLLQKARACPASDSHVWSKQSEQSDRLSEVDRPLDFVSIEYDEKYGRYLTAKKNYNPGDVIFSDKLYASLLTSTMNHTNCKYCLKTCWTGIPCDDCSWAAFCSEECKKKGCDSFHDVECSAGPYLSTLFQEKITKTLMIRFSFRILLIGLKEAGSLTKLKEDLKSVDECTDNLSKGFYKDGEFKNSTIQSVYSLTSRNISQKELDDLAFDALAVLISVVKRSKLIDGFQFAKIDDVMNEDLIFLGSLLIKLTLISLNNGFSLVQKHIDCRRKSSGDAALCCGSGTCLAAFASLINHSCNPNACTALVDGGKLSILALKPIKENSQIFISYNGNYYDKSLENRAKIFNAYNFTCECKACIQRWPMFFSSPFDVDELSDLEYKLYESCTSTFEQLNAKKVDFDKKDIEKLCTTIAQAHKHLTEPNYLVAMLNNALNDIYSCVYRCKSYIYSIETCNKV